MGSESESELYVVDFSDENMKPGSDAWLSAKSVVRTALEDHGCFVARYDKIGKELCDSVVLAMEQLFSLPVETKSQKTNDKLFHGYLGQYSLIPLYESVGIDNAVTIEGCQKFANIMWPEGNDPFCESITEYSKLLRELDHLAKRMVFESYGVDKEQCDFLIESSDYLFRCMKYRTRQMDENDLGIHSHSDITIMSIVHQLNNLNGLQIKLKDGEWIGVDASQPSFVVMAGDIFNAWSNGRIRPCEHRVIMNAKKTRYSTGLFSFCAKVIRIPEELVTEQHPLRYKATIDHFDYLRFHDQNKIKETDARIQAYFGI